MSDVTQPAGGPTPRPPVTDVQALLASAAVVPWEADAGNLAYTFMDDRAGQVFGRPAAEWLGDPGLWVRLVHPQDREQVLAERLLGARKLRAHAIAYRMLHAGGHYVPVFDIAHALRADGRPARLSGLIVQATAGPVAQARLDEQATLFEAVFNHVPDAMVITGTDRTIIASNPALQQTFGYAPDEVIGRSTQMLYASREAFERLGRDRFNAWSAETNAPAHAQFRRKDGGLFPVDAYGGAIRDSQGRILGYLGMMRDATARLRAEDDLRNSEKRFRDFASAASDWFWEMDEQLRFSHFSERFHEVTGVAPERLLGKTPQETGIPGVDPKTWERHLQDLAAHRPFRGFIHPRTRADGSEVWLSISGIPQIDDDGRFLGYRGIGSDITDRIRVEREIRQSEERFRQFAEMGADFFWETDPQLRYTRIYGRFQAIIGVPPEARIGRSRMDVILPCLEQTDAVRHARQMAEHQPFEDLVYRVRGAGGQERILQSSGQPYFGDTGGFLGYRGAARDITDERGMAEQLAHQASHDSLTGLVNRRELEVRLARALESANAAGVHHSLCYLDLDQFKIVNDTCGHAAGDELLRQVSTLIASHLRTRDTLARLGGDEFGVLLENCPLGGARNVAENLRRAVQDYRFAWGDTSFSVGVSIGVVPLGGETDNVARALSAADSACYVAKDNGRNRIHVLDSDDFEVTRRNTEMEWVAKVTRAIEQDRMELWFQPIAAITPVADTGDHFELLVRMRGEDGELIPPGVFLTAAERYGVASRIDRWVVGHALSWFRDHPEQIDTVSLCSINLSGQSLSEQGFLQFTHEAVDTSPLPAHRICFEITETAAIQNLDAARQFIETFKSQGCLFALDDFGCGVSSFAYLKTLDVDFLKVDGMFVKGLDTDPVDLAMVRSINEVGHVMGKRTIAECVENKAILRKLQGIGVDFAQGFCLGRPAPLRSRLDTAPGRARGVVTPFRRARG